MTPGRQAMEKLAKWRMAFAGKWLGTRLDSDPEVQCVRDLFDKTICLRAEVNAMTALLIKAGIFSATAFDAQLAEEAAWLGQAYERQFPVVSQFD